ncbi:MAG TPA: cobyrinic acid a,c-diamide synthase, partial [Idiomarina sp.]|nr:cobyrinic acid a,c-diamide synthase [Idiomarina sp.]
EKALDWPIPAQAGGHMEFFLEQLITSADNANKQDVANE